jgi:hypothetical protein
MTFLYLVPTGMNDPMEPTWGSWGGRYGLNPQFPGKNYYFANAADVIEEQAGLETRATIHRDNTVKRWAADLQNDFRARMDWCVKPYAEANHPPKTVLNGHTDSSILKLSTRPGHISLSALGSADPDGQKLTYRWFAYPEAGTFSGSISIPTFDAPVTRVAIPEAAAGKVIHIILAVRDQGDPPLTRYRRIVISVTEREP